MRWLILSAFEPEMAPLRPLLGGAGNVAFVPVGVGLVDAAIGADRALDDHPFTAVIFVGTCGAFEESALQIGDVIVSRAAKMISPLAVEGRAAFPDALVRGVVSDAALAHQFVAAGCRHADIATTLAITTHDPSASSIATEADVEHLETFAAARAASLREHPFVAVLGVANMVGSRGRAEWRENHERVSAIVAEKVAAVIRAWPEGT